MMIKGLVTWVCPGASSMVTLPVAELPFQGFPVTVWFDQNISLPKPLNRACAFGVGLI